jgi:putative transposase
MANTCCSLNIHCIFSTKERAPMLNPELRERLWPFLGGIAKQNGITPRCIGGVADHVHLLLSLPTTVPIAKAIQFIKAGSSAWIDQTFRQLDNFSWQQGYGAFSVSGMSIRRAVACSCRAQFRSPRFQLEKVRRYALLTADRRDLLISPPVRPQQ